MYKGFYILIKVGIFIYFYNSSSDEPEELDSELEKSKSYYGLTGLNVGLSNIISIL